MKQLSLILILSVLFISCDKNNDDKDVGSNNVVLLKVDYLTNTFEGGKVLKFSESTSFTISSKYNSPGDFGSVALYYEELNKKLFEGTIIWMGLGEMSYPSSMDLPAHFSKTDTNVTLPDTEMFKRIMYTENAYYPDSINYESLWNAINNLRIVSSCRNSNPHEKVQLFLYTPSLGVGDPADWDWFVILRS
ncbi:MULTISPECIES: hypothetical protein [Flavobacteriaceae]|uniref:Lipoprotein n=2 Tax=Flavobacteriaceae TaxID=49546 RepID=A0A4Y8AW89_9FLAO|nr:MULTISPECIES: hypothetical protein [Flavobacteriaceae]TEW76806.1 hypothetical protein E2488_02870 [Gramella jeungdoensis]GGK49839.1 hypothetical protein GCM10007963_17770 [Lutibacter litoralis]